MSERFSKRNSQLMEALCALDLESVKKVKPLLDLSKTDLVEAEFSVARQFLKTQIACSGSNENKWTPIDILQRFSGPLSTMPTVLTALKHVLTFGASTATCENSFFTLTNVFSKLRRSMLHPKKAKLIQLAFEGIIQDDFGENGMIDYSGSSTEHQGS
ncbi:hypothetical protein J4Q44_G00057740 [Coregonus suidteri]|uniref:HAT C-terminal dimerisation domain-containing protein n=1 Tax=Coregonus suidteri TaxID=861788 RepID=A0AAN8R0C9_9TELE